MEVLEKKKMAGIMSERELYQLQNNGRKLLCPRTLSLEGWGIKGRGLGKLITFC